MRTLADTTFDSERIAPITGTREDALLRQYGELVTLKEVAFQLKFPSPDAVRKCHERGSLPLELFRFPKRRGLYAYTRALARLLNQPATVPKQRSAQ